MLVLEGWRKVGLGLIFSTFFGFGGGLMIMTVVGLTIAYLFRPTGLGVVFWLALFQVLLVLTTALPVMKSLRKHDATDGGERND